MRVYHLVASVLPSFQCHVTTSTNEPRKRIGARCFRADLATAAATVHRLVPPLPPLPQQQQQQHEHNTSVACFDPTYVPEGNGCASPISQQGTFWIQNNILIYANHLLIAGIDGSWPCQLGTQQANT